MRIQRKLNKFYIDNHGCAKNQVDAEEMAAKLELDGWEQCFSLEEAELVIVNSCGFIDAAKQESINAVIDIKTAWPEKKILLAGCLSERYSLELQKDLPEANAFFGNGDLSKITEAAFAAIDKKDFAASTIIKPDRKAYLPGPRKTLFGFPNFAYVKISEGCNNRCTFCAIPSIRGALSSRPIDDIVSESLSLLNSGVYELCFVGQDLASYGYDNSGHSEFKNLLEALNKAIVQANIKAPYRIRFLYMHPDHFPLELLPILQANSSIAPYFDIPFQHASEAVLKAMNRRGNSDMYLQLIEKIRSALPQAVIRSTFLLGFPGETDADFDVLLDFQKKAELDWLGVFEYSREENTPAYLLKNRISKTIVKKRKEQILDAQSIITNKKLSRFINTRQEVLIEENLDGYAIARGYMNAPDVDGSIVVVGTNLAAGQVLNVKITAVRGFDLEAIPSEANYE